MESRGSNRERAAAVTSSTAAVLGRPNTSDALSSRIRPSRGTKACDTSPRSPGFSLEYGTQARHVLSP
eukprot:CAMPEP_0204297102 /NCGR_PEP_ID=MMETSP0468-20130131/72591_1 /ASSEMBLY_ACC=CAM_ASM_000383 /TAXON_ID=2969 /ORGANISM="Oxyrrhis marina" /LENGTH=67 /DNA_ID=CAMNT_0051275869 /DNA_START=182 /DNA_END=382 /DNA_ORIENTATION=+